MTTPNQLQAPIALQTLPTSTPRSSSNSVAPGTQQTQQAQQAGQQQNTSQSGHPVRNTRSLSSQIGSIWAKAANNSAVLLLTAAALAVAFIFGKIAAGQGDSNLRATLWRDCIDLPEKIGDTLTCKKLLAGGFDSLSSNPRSKRSLSSPARLGDNGLVLFWQEICLIEERFILEPLLRTFLLAADILVASLALSPILLVAVYLNHVWVLQDRNRALYTGPVLFMLYFLGIVDIYGLIHIYGFGVVEEKTLLWGLLRLGIKIMVLVLKSRPHSIHSIFIKAYEGSERMEASGLLLIAIPAVIAVAEFYLTSLTGSPWFYGPYSLEIHHEAVNRWKEDNVQILCLPLTALLIALLIMRVHTHGSSFIFASLRSCGDAPKSH